MLMQVWHITFAILIAVRLTTGQPFPKIASSSTVRTSANRVSFAPVTTSGLTVEITLQAQFGAGILEWSVDASR